MLYHEIAYYNTNVEKDKLVSDIFTAIDKKIDGVAIYPYYISLIANYLPANFTLACPVDYPYGNSESKVRQHNILSNIALGANTIDLVLQNIYLLNDYKQFKKDLKAAKSICDEKAVKLRVFYEYRQVFNAGLFKKLKESLVESDIAYVFPSTGQFVDNYADHLIAAKAFMIDTDIEIICSANVFNRQQYEVVKDANIYGVRFHSNINYINCVLP